MGTDCTGSCKSNNHTIKILTAPETWQNLNTISNKKMLKAIFYEYNVYIQTYLQIFFLSMLNNKLIKLHNYIHFSYTTPLKSHKQKTTMKKKYLMNITHTTCRAYNVTTPFIISYRHPGNHFCFPYKVLNANNR